MGYSHTVYLFDRNSVAEQLPLDHLLWTNVPLPKAAPLWVASVRTGVDLGTNQSMTGFSLGYSSTAITRLPVRESQRLELRYNPRQPEQAIARLILYNDHPTKHAP